MNRRQYLAAACGAAAFTAGCLGDGERDMDPSKVVTTVEITLQEGFEPMTVSIEPDEGVEWVNEDEFMRRVVTYRPFHDESAEWDWQAELDPGEDDFYVFDEPGVYDYFDETRTENHACGSVFVGDFEETDDHLPCASRVTE